MKLILPPLALVALLVAVPLTAEQLVLRDGTEVEIRGDFERRGALVVFTLASGTLGSMRADQVDFEATEAANAAADAAPESAAEETTEVAPARPAPPPVLVLTSADLPPVSSPPPSPADAGAAGEGEAGPDSNAEPAPDAAAAPAAGSVFVPLEGALAVTGWSVQDTGGGDGLELIGTLVNSGGVLAVEIAVTVSIGGDGDGGGDARTFEAFVANPTLGPGRRTSFRALLRGEFTAPESPEFTVAGRGLRPRIVPEPADGETDDGETASEGETADEGLSDDTSGSPRDRRP